MIAIIKASGSHRSNILVKNLDIFLIINANKPLSSINFTCDNNLFIYVYDDKIFFYPHPLVAFFHPKDSQYLKETNSLF